MSFTPKVSVIVPVYKVRNYIERCLQYLFGQTLDNMEFIFIDDCGNDGSIEIIGEVLETFPHRKGQTRIIHHAENKGVAQSRQDGLNAAMGEYVIHCDPDDWPEIEMYEKLYEKGIKDEADVVLCDFVSAGDNCEHTYTQRPIEMNGFSIIRQITKKGEDNLIGSVWNKLIRRNVAQSNSFLSSISYCEDALYLFGVLNNDLKISYLDKAFYHYLVSRPDSLVKQFGKNAIVSDLKLFETIREIKSTNSEISMALNRFIGIIICERIFRYTINKKELKQLRQYASLINFSLPFPKATVIKTRGAISINYKIFKTIYYIVPSIKKNIKRIFIH